VVQLCKDIDLDWLADLEVPLASLEASLVTLVGRKLWDALDKTFDSETAPAPPAPWRTEGLPLESGRQVTGAGSDKLHDLNKII